MTITPTAQLSPSQDYALMMRQALIRQAQSRIEALSTTIVSAQLPAGWTGSAADQFLFSFKEHLAGFQRPLVALEDADRMIGEWRTC